MGNSTFKKKKAREREREKVQAPVSQEYIVYRQQTSKKRTAWN